MRTARVELIGELYDAVPVSRPIGALYEELQRMVLFSDEPVEAVVRTLAWCIGGVLEERVPDVEVRRQLLRLVHNDIVLLGSRYPDD